MAELAETMDQAAYSVENVPSGISTGVKILLDIDKVLNDEEIASLENAF